ncbi:dimethyladenosine transferase 2, mitochondrial-like [Tubulanus polymorphus]|uniref:dimethyladenosine transferase 2, mitochondrial-like n=1 Tax=Tubulanus polymorphus TaxID=672921 RepID=UPI003DA3926B
MIPKNLWIHLTKRLDQSNIQTTRRYNSQLFSSKFPFLEKPAAKKIGAYILDKSLAETIVKSLVAANQLKQDVTPWLEVNPGPGYLSEALLEAGIRSLTVVERRQEFMPYLQRLKTQYPDFSFHQKDFFNRGALQKEVHEFFREVVPNLQIHSFNEKPPLKIIVSPGIAYERRLIKILLNQLLISSISLFSYGRMEFIMILSSLEKQRLMLKWPISAFAYRERNALFSLMFDVDFLQKIDPGGIFPPQVVSNYKKKTKQGQQVSESLHVVRITPKEGLFTHLFNQRHLPMFAFFVKEMLVKRSQRLIPKMEVFFPGCGLQMIDEGYTMDQITGDISPDDFVKLFKNVLSWPDFEESNFISLYRRFQGEHITDIDVS